MCKKLLSETFEIIRPVGFFLIAITVLACAMAMKGWVLASMLLAAVIMLTGILLTIQLHRTVSLLRRRSRMIAEAAAQAERHYIDVLRRIVRFVEARDDYRHGHSERVACLSEKTARQLGLDEEMCALLNVAGQLHDIGLFAVPESVLIQRSQLGADAFQSVEKHARVAYEVLQPLESLAEILPGVLYHHERLNGTGYPAGIAEEKIPLQARILAVADSYDAMTHDRPHRPGMSSMAAIQELRRCVPEGYDTICVEALADVVNVPQLQEALACAQSQ